MIFEGLQQQDVMSVLIIMRILLLNFHLPNLQALQKESTRQFNIQEEEEDDDDDDDHDHDHDHDDHEEDEGEL